MKKHALKLSPITRAIFSKNLSLIFVLIFSFILFCLFIEGIQETQQFKFSTEASLEMDTKKFFVRAPEKVRHRRAAVVPPVANVNRRGPPNPEEQQ